MSIEEWVRECFMVDIGFADWILDLKDMYDTEENKFSYSARIKIDIDKTVDSIPYAEGRIKLKCIIRKYDLILYEFVRRFRWWTEITKNLEVEAKFMENDDSMKSNE